MHEEQFKDWYYESHEVHKRMAQATETLLHELVAHEDLALQQIESRVKTWESARSKLHRKGYVLPAEEMTDIVGIRVITFLSSDVRAIIALLEKEFKIDRGRSGNTAERLSDNSLGYLSHHLICEYLDSRCALPEYSAFRGKIFEIQIRTTLQHAWAAIEHDRNYKLSGGIPKNLRRRLFLTAGLLEMADRELEQIVDEVNKYLDDVRDTTRSGDLSEIEINTPSILSWFEVEFPGRFPPSDNMEAYPALLTEMDKFGIHTLQDLSDLLDEKRIQRVTETATEMNILGLIRGAMMDEDIHRYFSDAYDAEWGAMSTEEAKHLENLYGPDVVRELFEENNITVIDP